MKIKPLADRVVIKLVEEEETSKGGLILTGSAKENRRLLKLSQSAPAAMSMAKTLRRSSRLAIRFSPASTPAPKSRLTARNAPLSARAISWQSLSKL